MSPRRYSSLARALIAVLCASVFSFAVPPVAARADAGTQTPAPAVQTISPEPAHEALTTQPGIFLLDVRTQSEFDESRIPGAYLIPHDEIERISETPVVFDTSIYVYCRTGVRSANAASVLARLGYTQVYDLGGIVSWPYETASGAYSPDEAYEVQRAAWADAWAAQAGLATPDAGTSDTGASDTGAPDSGTSDTGTPGTGTPGTGTPGTGTPGTGTPDTGTPDTGTPDIGTPDIGTPDIGTPDIGTPDIGTPAPSATPKPETNADGMPLVPDFSLTNQAGETVRFGDFSGKVLVLNLWASWCGPCRQEMPHFQKMYEGLTEDGGVALLSINLTDGQSETRERADAFMAESGYTFPIYYDESGEAAYVFSAQSIPRTFIIDADGYLVNYQVGSIEYDMLMSMLGEAAP